MKRAATETTDIPRMTEKQFSRAKKLLRRLCANYDRGNCLLLDDGYDACLCPQLLSNTLLCRYFRSAVLPADMELWAEVLGQTGLRKRCAACGNSFFPTGSRSLYCPGCAAVRERRRKAEWARKNRVQRRRLEPPKR